MAKLRRPLKCLFGLHSDMPTLYYGDRLYVCMDCGRSVDPMGRVSDIHGTLDWLRHVVEFQTERYAELETCKDFKRYHEVATEAARLDRPGYVARIVSKLERLLVA